jgi:hypothetical protein
LYAVQLAGTFLSIALGKRLSRRYSTIGDTAPMRKNHSVDRYIEPFEKRLFGPMRPQNVAFVA